MNMWIVSPWPKVSKCRRRALLIYKSLRRVASFWTRSGRRRPTSTSSRSSWPRDSSSRSSLARWTSKRPKPKTDLRRQQLYTERSHPLRSQITLTSRAKSRIQTYLTPGHKAAQQLSHNNQPQAHPSSYKKWQGHSRQQIGRSFPTRPLSHAARLTLSCKRLNRLPGATQSRKRPSSGWTSSRNKVAPWEDSS